MKEQNTSFRVRLKTYAELKEMIRNGDLDFHLAGERLVYCTKGNPQHCLTIDPEDMGAECLVVDHPKPISKEIYESRKILFQDIKGGT